MPKNGQAVTVRTSQGGQSVVAREPRPRGSQRGAQRRSRREKTSHRLRLAARRLQPPHAVIPKAPVTTLMTSPRPTSWPTRNRVDTLRPITKSCPVNLFTLSTHGSTVPVLDSCIPSSRTSVANTGVVEERSTSMRAVHINLGRPTQRLRRTVSASYPASMFHDRPARTCRRECPGAIRRLPE
jgi:hypothetical protein